MKEKILTEHQGQKLSIKWDDERFAIVEEWDIKHGYGGTWSIVLNPREALEAAFFILTHSLLDNGEWWGKLWGKMRRLTWNIETIRRADFINSELNKEG